MTNNPAPAPTEAPDPVEEIAALVDRLVVATVAEWTRGISPAAQASAWFDWTSHLLFAPGKLVHLAIKASRKEMQLGRFIAASRPWSPADPVIEPLPQDHRWDDPAWRDMPYALWQQSFLLWQQWWDAATRDVPGLDPHHDRMVNFVSRQVLDILAPSNSIFTNPVVQRRPIDTGGTCLIDGAHLWQEDLTTCSGTPRRSARRPSGQASE